jgi:mono/diheme cytochrome c family protein
MRGFGASLFLLAAVPFVSAAAPAPEPAISFEHQVAPVLQTYCYDCHGDGKHKGGVALDKYADTAAILADRKTWETVLHHVNSREMPPDDADEMPSDAQRELIGTWLEQELYHFDARHPDPGRVIMRRLNRAEYNATIRDLVGVDFKPASDFPPDDSGYGFDNIGDVLSLPPVLMEKYLAAADKVLDQAIVTDPIKSEVRHIPASLAEIGFNAIGDRGDGWIHLISLEEDDVAVPLNVPAGDYLVRILAFATRDGGALIGQGSEKAVAFKVDPGPTKIGLMVNDTLFQDFALTTDEAHPQVYEARVSVPAGRQYFRASMRRKRGGSENELFMLNGRIGRQQPGIGFVKWIEVEGPLPAATRRTPASQLEVKGDGRFTAAGERVLEHNGEVANTFSIPREAEVILRAQAYAQQAGNETARMEFRLDGQPVKTFDVIAPATMVPLPGQHPFSPALLVPQPWAYEFRTKLPPGPHRFAAAFVNEFADPENKNPNLRKRDLIVQNLEVSNLAEPVIPPSLPEPIARLFAAATAPAKPSALARLVGTKPKSVDQTAAARGIIAPFARRAWRRPVEAAEVDRLLKLYDLARAQGDSFEAGVKLAMKAVLVSPHFLFIGDTPPALVPSAEPRPLDEFALATRLSYFIWSSMPDDELLDLAERGQLRANLAPQVRRMLASPKARALVDNFAGQWLQIRSLETFQPDKKLFPDYDPALRTAMQRETELFFERVMREDRSVFDFLTGDYTFVNARLAKLYGLPGVNGDEFQLVSLAGTPRRGVLTQASILTLTSNPTRTSPVKRGKWVLENLLGTPPPPPPPTVPSLDDASRQLTGSLRQQMEQHRANATCASCHARMDPIGFSLENFNAIGAWRDKDGESPIDASGKLVSGDSFAGAAELANLLADKKRRDYLHCLAEKMLTYALGRGPEYYDRPALDQIVHALNHDQDRFSGLILAVAQSFPFQMRRGDAPAVPALAAR